jgi:alkyldihydroxyacetonephosphate synthase
LTLLKNAWQIKDFEPLPLADLTKVAAELRKPRFKLTKRIQAFCTDDAEERMRHSYGQAFRDLVRALQGQYDNPPDYVAFPRSESQLLSLFAFSKKRKIALIPYGGGTSVVGGVEPPRHSNYPGVISVDMKYFDKLLRVDKESLIARVQAGIYGPDLIEKLKAHGVTLRHFPQSFEFSTVGGWIATRAGGHYATLKTHIDDFVVCLRVVTPQGIIETKRLPASGAGPSPDRLFIGSEGILGIITEAELRVQQLIKFRINTTVSFPSLSDGIAALRAIAQSGLNPTNCRLVDALESSTMGLSKTGNTTLLLGFESATIHDVDDYMKPALDICRTYDGTWNNNEVVVRMHKSGDQEGAIATWRENFMHAPYLRDNLVKLGLIVETFETACTWDRFAEVHNGIISAVEKAIEQQCEGKGFVTMRVTHVYSDGLAPYYTVIAKGKNGKQLEQWDYIKRAASEAILRLGATITHHHAVGRDHQIYYLQEKSPLYVEVLAAAKQKLDPLWIMNPEVILNVPPVVSKL